MITIYFSLFNIHCLYCTDSILFPDVPIALRLSSHLLLGVVRIYNRKVNYLFDDCSEALLKIKQAFRSTAVDLPPEESKAPYHSITLPEKFDLDDFELPDSDIFQGFVQKFLISYPWKLFYLYKCDWIFHKLCTGKAATYNGFKDLSAN